MEILTDFIQNNVQFAPYIIFGLLLLAGLNIPVSEDLMVFIAAVMSVKYPDMMVPLFVGLIAGAYLSDVICYFLGRILGDRIWSIKGFSNMVSKKRIEQVGEKLDRYGILTILIGRFIPFGVRNALFLTAGFSKMNAGLFAIADGIACAISVSLYFYLYYTFGEAVIDTIKRFNYIIFGVFFVAIVVFLLRKFLVHRPHSN